MAPKGRPAKKRTKTISALIDAAHAPHPTVAEPSRSPRSRIRPVPPRAGNEKKLPGYGVLHKVLGIRQGKPTRRCAAGGPGSGRAAVVHRMQRAASSAMSPEKSMARAIDEDGSRTTAASMAGVLRRRRSTRMHRNETALAAGNRTSMFVPPPPARGASSRDSRVIVRKDGRQHCRCDICRVKAALQRRSARRLVAPRRFRSRRPITAWPNTAIRQVRKKTAMPIRLRGALGAE